MTRGLSKPTVVITNEHTEPGPTDRAHELMTSTIRRPPPDCLDPKIKSINYLVNILAQIQAVTAGAYAALMLDTRGFVAEATGQNVFIVKNSKMFTPLTTNCLEGITRATVIEITRKSGVDVVEKDISLYEIYNADEMFLSGTSEEIGPVVRVDGRIIGDGKIGPITRKIVQLYQDVRITGVPV